MRKYIKGGWLIPKLDVALSGKFSAHPQLEQHSTKWYMYHAISFKIYANIAFLREEELDIPIQSKSGPQQVRHSHASSQASKPTKRSFLIGMKVVGGHDLQSGKATLLLCLVEY